MCLVATSAKAHEVQIGLDQRIGVQSNLFPTTLPDTAGGFYQIAPRLILAQPESDFTYRVEYLPNYRVYFDTDNADGWDQFVRARARQELDDRNALSFNTEYLQAQAIRGIGTIDASGQPVVLTGLTGTTRRFIANLAYDHAFSSRTNGMLALDYNRWDYSNPTSVDNQGFGVFTQVTHALRERVVVGSSLNGRYRAFSETAAVPASYTTVVNMNLLVQFQITPTLRLEASGGPAGFLTRQGTPGPQWVSRWEGVSTSPSVCPIGPCGRLWNTTVSPVSLCPTQNGIPVLQLCSIGTTASVLTGSLDQQVLVQLDPNQTVFGQSNEELTYFLNLGVTKSFRRGSISAFFERNEDAGSGIGATTILNTVSARVLYSIDDLWQLSVSGVYTRRTSVSQLPFTEVSAEAAFDSNGVPVTGDSGYQLAQAGLLIARAGISNFEQSIGFADVRLTRRLTERARLQFLFTYYNRSQQNQGVSAALNFDNYVGGVSFIYEFEPYKL